VFRSKSVHPVSGVNAGIDPGRSARVSSLGSVLSGLTKTMLEPMCQGDFLSKSATTILEFLEDLDERTMQWKTTHDNNLSSRFARGELHFVSDVSYLESKIAILENMLKELSP